MPVQQTAGAFLDAAREALLDASAAAENRPASMGELRTATGRLTSATTALSGVAETLRERIAGLPTRLVLHHDDPKVNPVDAINAATAALAQFARHVEAAIEQAQAAHDAIWPIGIDADLDA